MTTSTQDKQNGAAYDTETPPRTFQSDKQPPKTSHIPLRREHLLLFIRGALLFTVTLLFARCETLFGARPLGIAFLVSAESGVFFIFAALIASALPMIGGAVEPMTVIVATAVVLLRIGARMTIDLPWPTDDPEVRTVKQFSRTLFHEHIALRMMIGCVGAFLLGMYRMIGGGYRFYDLFASLFLMIAAPLAAYAFGGLWKTDALSLRSIRTTLSVVVTIALLVLSLKGMQLYRVSLAAALALIATLWLTSRRGGGVGILGGLLFGLALDPISAPLFAFAALGYAALRRTSILLASFAAMGIGMAWGLYVYGLSALSALFPALILSSMLFVVLERLGFLPGGDVERQLGRTSYAPEIAKASEASRETRGDVEEERLSLLRTSLEAERLRAEERKIDDLCSAFQAVSELLERVHAEEKYPPESDLRRVCDRVCDEFCPGCASCNLCWGSEYAEMATLLGRMAEILHRQGRIGKEILPKKVLDRCKMSAALLSRINEEAALLTESSIKHRGSGTLSADYAAAAKLFRSASQSIHGGYRLDEQRSRGAERLLEENGVYPSRVAVSAGDRGSLYAWNVDREATEAYLAVIAREGEEKNGRSARDAFINTVGFAPDLPIFTPVKGCRGFFDLRIDASPRFSITSSCFCRSAENKKGEHPCGDTVAVFESNDGRSFALLSDGMGKGKDAARRSEVCCVFLQKMLESGGDTVAILHMLNDFLRAGTISETSATVDLFELDRFSGEGKFWKSGAAPSFILRDGNLFRLSSRTAPAGILQDMDVQKTAFRLIHGDVVVLLSDGIADGIGEEGDGALFLESALCGVTDGDSLRAAAENIARSAPKREGASPDDRSVILLRIDERDALTTLPAVRSA